MTVEHPLWGVTPAATADVPHVRGTAPPTVSKSYVGRQTPFREPTPIGEVALLSFDSNEQRPNERWAIGEECPLVGWDRFAGFGAGGFDAESQPAS
jgi:hypothetical protein